MRRRRHGTHDLRKCAPLVAHRVESGVTSEISLRNETDETAALVDDRQPAHLVPRHLPHAFRDGFVRIAREYALRHAIGNDGITRITTARDDPNGNVAIREHPDKHAVISDHGQRSAVAFLHQPRRAFDGSRRMHARDTPRHQLVYAELFDVGAVTVGLLPVTVFVPTMRLPFAL